MAEFKDEKLYNVSLVDEVKTSFLEYSMSVIMSRALPDVRDGLKPVHRRILYTMYEIGLSPDAAYRKSVGTVGEVLARYHPHGEASVYDAMVRMAQDFSLRYMLVDGHGNFGSIDGYPAAAYRYTEAKMSKISMAMLEDIDKDTVDWQSNFEDRLKEPVVLPARFPNLLVNGSTGIAVGMATNIPPHNLCEVIDAMCYLIDNPDCEMEDLNAIIKGPDFPTGGIIMGTAGIRSAYATGKGKVTLRGRVEIEEKSDGKYRLIVTEVPYMVNKLNLVKSINDLIDDKKIEGINDVIDYSNREGIRIEIDLKKDAPPQIVLNQLYKLTQLQVTVGIIMLALVNNQPKVLTLKSMLQEYISHQNEIIRRKTQFNLKKAEERAHILKGLAIALDHIEEVIKILRAAKSINEGKENLIERFGLDDVQATAIVQMQLGRLTGLERKKIEDELDDLMTKISGFLEILADNSKQLEIVKNDALKIRDRYNDDRRTEISPVSGEVDIIDLIPNEQCVLTLTSFGYIKRLSLDTYKTQHRGGRGIAGMTQREEDFAQHMFVCKAHDNILFFTNAGKVYTLKAYEVPEGSRTSKGLNIVNILPLTGDEKVTKMLKVTEFEENRYLFMVTKCGVAKRVSLSRFSNVRKNGVICIVLDDEDELNFVEQTAGVSEIVVATKKGMSVRFLETAVREMGRVAHGVRALRMREGDEVIGMVEGTAESMVLTISETGFGRRSPISDYRLSNRGNKGVINYRTAKYGDVSSVKIVDENDDVIIITNNGVIIRIEANQISAGRRPGKGVKVMRVTDDQKIIGIATVEHDDEKVVELPLDDSAPDDFVPDDTALDDSASDDSALDNDDIDIIENEE